MIRRFDDLNCPHPEFWEHCRAMEKTHGLPMPIPPGPEMLRRTPASASHAPASPTPLDPVAVLHAMFSSITLERWLAITDKAVEQAMAGDHRARQWLTQFLIPRKRR